MNKTLPLLAISITLMVLFAGCTMNSQSPKELFTELSRKAETLPNGKYSYTYTWEVTEIANASIGAQFPSVNYDLKIYSLNGNKKSLLKMEPGELSTDTSYFEVDGENTSCIKSDLDLGLNPPSVVCQKYGESAKAPFLSALLFTLEPNNLEKIELNLTGEKTYAGRPCQEFFVNLGEDIFGEIKGSFGPSTSTISAEYTACLDKEHGFSLYTETSMFSNANNTEEEIAKTTLQLNSYNPNAANPSDFEIPSDAQWLPPQQN